MVGPAQLDCSLLRHRIRPVYDRSSACLPVTSEAQLVLTQQPATARIVPSRTYHTGEVSIIGAGDRCRAPLSLLEARGFAFLLIDVLQQHVASG